ncbi:O-succinylbenzoate synthase [hydrothermal vent metagenome]|uniref:O-succinylbenzoate synthase n=1 Tax=hydrothermal vent metagenome TaxID=652676 RepID=A0A3B0UMA5_9ZZZZ
MALKFEIECRELEFLFNAGTSRGILTHRKTWFIKVWNQESLTIHGIGEAGPLRGLSIDDIPDFEFRLKNELIKLEKYEMPSSEVGIYDLAKKVDSSLPSVRFGVETALLDLYYGGKKKCFINQFYDEEKPVWINGLVWMGESELMLKRLKEKLKSGFTCIKLKIGALNFEDEIRLLEMVRKKYTPSELELRVDANGAFSYTEVDKILNSLNKLGVHSIEQPIKAGQPELMAELCRNTPIPIALDEELIGVNDYQAKADLLQRIMPQFIILKPSLLGGFASCLEWIKIAEKLNIGWWLTSALESNIGLNAICQFASSLHVKLPQGLGTGGLYANNIESPLELNCDLIYYKQNKKWHALGMK